MWEKIQRGGSRGENFQKMIRRTVELPGEKQAEFPFMKSLVINCLASWVFQKSNKGTASVTARWSWFKSLYSTSMAVMVCPPPIVPEFPFHLWVLSLIVGYRISLDTERLESLEKRLAICFFFFLPELLVGNWRGILKVFSLHSSGFWYFLMRNLSFI